MPGVPTCARVRAKSHKGEGGGGSSMQQIAAVLLDAGGGEA